jgi:hypothetical protein
MPYRHAHYYLLLLIALTALAFWPIYFSVLPSASVALHIHGVSASLWIALLGIQSWTIHHRRNEWHRALGILSLAIFPVFFAGSMLIVHTMALNFASGDFFDGRFGARFAALDLVAVPAIGWLYFSGLRCRRKVHLHARYMLATVFFLFEPIFSRLFLQYIPGLGVTPPEFARLPLDVELSTAGALLLALALAWRHTKYGRPWLITAGLLALQMVLFPTLGVVKPWEELVRAFAATSGHSLFSFGLAIGAAISWLGWKSAPTRPVRSLATAEPAGA